MSDDEKIEPVSRTNNREIEWLYSEAFWLGAALATAALVGATVLMAAVLALFAFTPERLNENVDVIYKLGLIGVGIVTFCTVVWRGLITSRQADAQRDQLEKLSQQISATETTNRANLFQKGAELLAETDKPSRVSGGIALLRAVGTARDQEYSAQAMDILADFIKGMGFQTFGSELGQSAMAALEDISGACDQVSSRWLTFEWSPAPGTTAFHEIEYPDVQIIRGVKTVVYEHCHFNGAELLAADGQKTRYAFRGCTFFEGWIDLRVAEFDQCEIRNAHIIGIDPNKSSSRTTMVDCNFDNCEVDNAKRLADLRDGMNWFAPSNPPVADPPLPAAEWLRRLHARRPEREPDPSGDHLFYLPD